MDQASVIERNRLELDRLRKLLAELADSQLGLSLGEGWTVSAALAHMAYWDQRALVLLERWPKQEITLEPSDVINRASLPHWLALPPRATVDLALQAAEAINRKIESLPPDVFGWYADNPNTPLDIVRANHRGEHIDQIQQAIRTK
jgi:hypothetical protein